VSATDWLWFEDDALRKLAQAHLAQPAALLSVPTNHIEAAPFKFVPLPDFVAAFDWGGTLSSHEGVRWIARNYKQAGARVVIISAVGDDIGQDVNDQLRAQAMTLGVQVDDIYLVRGDKTVPETKAAILKQIGAGVFYDDVPENIRAAGQVCRAVLVGGPSPLQTGWTDELELNERLDVDYGSAVPTWVDYRLLRAIHCGDQPPLEPDAVELNLALVSTALLRQVGGMDESYDAVAGMSEKELAYRLREAGAMMVLEKRVRARAIEHAKEWTNWDAKVTEGRAKLKADVTKMLRDKPNVLVEVM